MARLSGLAALTFALGLAASVRAEGPSAVSANYNGYPGGYAAYGIGGGVYGLTSGFAGHPLAGLPNFQGSPTTGYPISPAQTRAFRSPSRAPVPMTANTMNGLIGTIRKQTGPVKGGQAAGTSATRRRAGR